MRVRSIITHGRTVICLGLTLVLVGVLFAPMAVVAAADPRPTPAAYYGELTAAGEPIPAGVTVTAEIDGEVRGELVTAEPGRFGDAGAFEPKLQVDGDHDEAGATVRFYVDGVEADETVDWEPGDVRSVDLAVPDAWKGSDGGGGGSGGSGGGGSPGGQTPDDDAPASVDVRPDPTDPAATDVTVTGSRAGETVSVDLGASEDGEFSMTGLELVPAIAGDFTLRLSPSPTPPDDGIAPPVADGVIGYVVVDHSIADADIDGVTFTFTVSATALSDRGIDPNAVALSRYHDGEWATLPTSHIETASNRHVFESDSPGLSVFAIAPQDAETGSSDGGTPTDDTADEDAADDTATDDAAADDTTDETGGSALWTVVAMAAAIAIAVGVRYARSGRR